MPLWLLLWTPPQHGPHGKDLLRICYTLLLQFSIMSLHITEKGVGNGPARVWMRNIFLRLMCLKCSFSDGGGLFRKMWDYSLIVCSPALVIAWVLIPDWPRCKQTVSAPTATRPSHHGPHCAYSALLGSTQTLSLSSLSFLSQVEGIYLITVSWKLT